MFKQVHFGPDAVEFVRACLAKGNHLAQAITRLPLESGRVFAFLGADAHEDAAKRFAVGGVTSTRTTQPLLANLIAGHLSDKTLTGSCALFEDALANPADPCVTPYLRWLRTFDNEVYYCLQADDSAPASILSVIRQASSHLFLAALTSGLSKATCHEPAFVEADFSRLAAKARYVVVGAYDGEGHLIWQRGESP